MYEQQVLNIEATGDTWTSKHDGSTMYELVYTIKSPDPKTLPPDADGNVRIKANHKTPNGPFQVGQIVDFEITRMSGPGLPHDGKAKKPGQGNFQNSRPAAPRSAPQAAPQPSGPVQSLDERIRNQVIFKGAITIWTNGAEKSIPQSVSDAIDMMEAVESQVERRVEEKAAAKKDAKAYAAEQYNKVLQEEEANVPF
jgi:hypothetical protein